ncbi:porin [Endozoicomonas sp. G2_2]|uniref:porin n=1 Tax=Endozoicomonas sp. G2_2 TaxID=2821092 RepID=UPI001ADA4982|nr:porin [Endozoicomonas sp. G2_2]MBO9468542.1 porin [Endozoicomonas sp. G2_2]
MRLRKLALSAAGSMALIGAMPAAQAIDMEAGDWTFSVNGNVNANYVYSSCDTGAPISFGGAIAGTVVGACNINGPIDDDVSSVRTGLLPAALVFTAATQQNGWDISGTFGLYPGIVTNDDAGGGGGSPNLAPGNNVGLGSTSLDIRQVFLKFGNADFGTVKAGRDFGLFGYDAIINDMTIPAVGVGTLAVGSPGNTTLGSIGFGYIYTDTLSQINYTTPDMGGFTATAGVFQTIDSLSSPSTVGVGESLPGFHGQLRYEWDGAFVSLNAVTLEVDGNDVDTDGDGVIDAGTQIVDDERVYGVDLNYKQNLGAIDFLISGYYTEGLGSVAYLFDSFDGQGDKRDSYGGLAQVTYTAGKNKFGLNYGVSYLDQTDFDETNVPDLFESNQKVTAGYYYSLTPNLTLTAEYSYAESQNHQDDEYDANNVNVGAFFAF